MSEEAPKQYHDDPLLDCLVVFAKRYHRPVSKEALLAGLPVEPGQVTPELFSLNTSKAMFSRVAARAGLAARLVNRDLDKLSELLLPCILVLSGRGACILEQFDHENGRAKVILPDIDGGETWLDLETLKEHYLNFAFLIKPEYQAETTEHRILNLKVGHWFWSTIKRSWEIYASVLIGSILINLFAIATPLFTMNVYDRVVPNEAVDTLWVLALGIGVVFVFDALMKAIRTHLIEVAGRKSDVIMSSILFEQALGLRLESWPKSTGEFANTFQQFESIRAFFASATIVALVDLPFALIFLFVISYIGDALVAVPLITMSIVLTYALIINQPLRASVRATYAATAKKHSLLVESLRSIQTLRTLGAERYSQWAWEEATGDIAGKSHRTRQLSTSISTVTGLLSQVNMVVLVIIGVHEIIALNLTMGGLIAAVVLSSRAIAPMGQVATLLTQFQQTKAAFRSLETLMNSEVERKSTQSYVRRPEFDGDIKFKNVSFSYPEAETATLKDVSLSIQPGEHVGIIGRVGSGKTTLAKLMIALYRPGAGSLLVDNLDINQIDPADLRRNMGYLSQDIELIRGTIRENITLKDPSVDDDLVLRAAHIAGVDMFVNQLPRGYDTILGENGAGLSGGQRQSVALARTILLNDKLLVLDEPTNDMDNSTESVIRNRLFEYTRDKTLVLITHKAPMLKMVERLVVVDGGRILREGPRADVLGWLRETGGPDMRDV